MSSVMGDLVRNLIIIIFLNALLEMMLPRGEFHRYIRLVTGLIVILLVVSAIGALMGGIPRLEPVIAANPVEAENSALTLTAREHDGVGSAYSRQVLVQCRTALENLLSEEIAARGEWRLAEARLLLDEDGSCGSFGAPLQIDLLVKAAGGERGRVIPVSIEPVAVGEERDAAGDAADGSAAGPPLTLPELERSLAALLKISPAQVTVTLCE